MAGGGEGAKPIDSKKSLPVMSKLRIDFAAFEIFWYMLDFKSLPLRSPAVILVLSFTNFCGGFYKLLLPSSQTFPVIFTNFCRVVHKLLM